MIVPCKAFRSNYGGLLVGSWCPCGAFLVVVGEARPTGGDLTLCPRSSCGEVLWFGADLTLRKLTRTEQSAVKEENFWELQRAATYARRRRRRGPWIPTPD